MTDQQWRQWIVLLIVSGVVLIVGASLILRVAFEFDTPLAILVGSLIGATLSIAVSTAWVRRRG